MDFVLKSQKEKIPLCMEFNIFKILKLSFIRRCVNFITEIGNYTWDEDRLGNKINRPIDDFNHLDGCNAICS